MSVTKADILLLCNLATGFTEQREFDKARTMLQQAEENAGQDGDMRGLVEMALCRLDWRSGDFEAAREHGIKALRLLQGQGDPDTLAQAMIYLGNAERRLGNLRSAESLYEQALMTTKNPQFIALAHWGLGNVNTDLERYEEAFVHYQSALEHSGESGDPRERGSLRMGLALAYRERGDLDRALELSGKALQIFEEAGQGELVADLHNNIGSIYVARGDRESARASYEQALAALQDENVVQAVEAYRELARLDIEIGRPGEAVDRAQAALELARRLKSSLEVARCSLVLGQALMGLNQPEAAIPHLRLAHQVFMDRGVKQSAIVAAQLLGDAERR